MTTTRAQGRKKSLFVAKTTVEAGGYLDYVVNGYNYRIAYTNFLSGLGVTGTIVQEGDVTGTPILDVDGTINNIRNIENGSGILANVSASNGVEIKHNFTASAVGTPVLLSTTAASPIIASLVAGSGISLAVSGTTGIEISSVANEIYAQSTMHGNATDTVIAVAGTAVLTAGTWVTGLLSSFTATTAGRLTYSGVPTAVVGVQASVTLKPVSGTNKSISVYLAKNGAVVTAARITRTVSTAETGNMSLFYNISLATNDYLEIFVANDTDTIDVLVTDALFGVA